MGRLLAAVYGIVAYVLFLVVFLYSIGFVTNQLVPKSIDSGMQGELVPSLMINAVLLAIFAVQHSLMARPGFKAWWTKIIPASIERSTYVMFSNFALMLLYSQWRPLHDVVWSVDGIAATVIWAVAGLGWFLVLISTFAISHFDLFGLRQVYLNLRNEKYHSPAFMTSGLYKIVRHPIMLGFIIAFWAAPHMTLGHLFFAVMTTAYIIIALNLEERDLTNAIGEDYKAYQTKVPMIVPFWGKK